MSESYEKKKSKTFKNCSVASCAYVKCCHEKWNLDDSVSFYDKRPQCE